MQSNKGQRLSRTQGAIRKGFAVDTYEGGFPLVQPINAPLAKDSDAVLAATALDVAAQTITVGITDPDVYRCLSVKGNVGTIYGQVRINGKDWAGRNVTELLLASGSTEAVGNIPFLEVDSVVLPPQVSSGEQISVGIVDKLGLWRPLAASDLELLEVDGVSESASAVDTDRSTFTPTTLPDGSANYKVYYLTDIF